MPENKNYKLRYIASIFVQKAYLMPSVFHTFKSHWQIKGTVDCFHNCAISYLAEFNSKLNNSLVSCNVELACQRFNNMVSGLHGTSRLVVMSLIIPWS